MLTLLKSSSSVLVTIRSMSVPICNHFRTKQANSGKIMSFQGCPFFSSLFMGTPITQWCKNLSLNNRDSRLLLYDENPKSLLHLGLDWYLAVMDG